MQQTKMKNEDAREWGNLQELRTAEQVVKSIAFCLETEFKLGTFKKEWCYRTYQDDEDDGKYRTLHADVPAIVPRNNKSMGVLIGVCSRLEDEEFGNLRRSPDYFLSLACLSVYPDTFALMFGEDYCDVLIFHGRYRSQHPYGLDINEQHSRDSIPNAEGILGDIHFSDVCPYGKFASKFYTPIDAYDKAHLNFEEVQKEHITTFYKKRKQVIFGRSHYGSNAGPDDQ